MAFDIKLLTDVTVGGTPDIGDEPTKGVLINLIEAIVDLSDELASSKTSIDTINTRNGSFYLGDEILDLVRGMIKVINTEKYKLQQMTYGDYHAYVRPIPTELKGKNYGQEYP